MLATYTEISILAMQQAPHADSCMPRVGCKQMQLWFLTEKHVSLLFTLTFLCCAEVACGVSQVTYSCTCFPELTVESEKRMLSTTGPMLSQSLTFIA